MSDLDSFNRLFPNEKSCEEYLDKTRWNGIVISPFSPTGKVYECANGMYRCRDTARYFTAKTGTIFHHSRLSLRTWFQAIWLMQENPAITSVALAEALGITQKSAWFMQQRIRQALGLKKSRQKHTAAPQTAEDKLNLLDWLSTLKK